jgi:hypothetical protein
MLVCAFFVRKCTRDRGCSAHPVFPAPSVFERANNDASLGQNVSRERETVSSAPASVAKQSIVQRGDRWIAHMGNVCVKDEQLPFCSTAATFPSRPRALQDDARRSSQGRPLGAAAQRLGLELSEHVIMLGRSGTTGAPRDGGSVRASSILALRSRVRAGSAIWVACQTKLTFGRRAGRLHQDSACGGQAREDETILRCGV